MARLAGPSCDRIRGTPMGEREVASKCPSFPLVDDFAAY
jgi:hypothetical protein